MRLFKKGDRAKTPPDYLKLCFPILLFPLLYVPYSTFWVRPFGLLAQRVLHGATSTTLQLFFTGNNTILLFWCLVTAVVMVSSLVLWIRKIRPWYVGLLYMAVMFSLCGILSLFCYQLIVGF